MKTEKDKCVICQCKTHENVDTHIEKRTCYIDGAGQMCFRCHDTLFNHFSRGLDYEPIFD